MHLKVFSVPFKRVTSQLLCLYKLIFFPICFSSQSIPTSCSTSSFSSPSSPQALCRYNWPWRSNKAADWKEAPCPWAAGTGGAGKEGERRAGKVILGLCSREDTFLAASCVYFAVIYEAQHWSSGGTNSSPKPYFPVGFFSWCNIYRSRSVRLKLILSSALK